MMIDVVKLASDNLKVSLDIMKHLKYIWREE